MNKAIFAPLLKAAPYPFAPPCCVNDFTNFPADIVQPFVFKMKHLNIHTDEGFFLSLRATFHVMERAVKATSSVACPCFVLKRHLASAPGPGRVHRLVSAVLISKLADPFAEAQQLVRNS